MKKYFTMRFLGKSAAVLLTGAALSVGAEEYKLGNVSDWHKRSGFEQQAPNVLHGKGRIVALSAKAYPYNPKKTYIFRGLYRQKPGSDSNVFRIGIQPLGADGKPLEYAFTHAVAKTDTVLKAAVKKEDKFLLVENASSWNKRTFIAFKTSPDRKDLPNRNLIRQRPVKIEKTANGYKVTFAKKIGVALPAGTGVRQHYVGGPYRYAAEGSGSKVLSNMKCRLWDIGTKSFRVVILSGTSGIKANEKIPVLELLNPRIEVK